VGKKAKVRTAVGRDEKERRKAEAKNWVDRVFRWGYVRGCPLAADII
jgi:hypothetical protein